MDYRHKLLIFSILSLLLSAVSCDRQSGYIAFSDYAQGGTYTVKIDMSGVDEEPQAIKDAVDSLLDVIDFTFSGYNKASLLSRLNAGEKVKPNAMLMDLYRKAYGFYKESDGALDVAAGPLFDVWGFGFTTDSLPSAQKVQEVLGSCGSARLKADMKDALDADGMLCAADLLIEESEVAPVLNFNALAQGYSCDVVASYLHSLGVRNMLVDIGEIFCEGVNPSGKPWTLGVDKPVDGNQTLGQELQAIHHCSSEPQGVVTSGNYRKFYVSDGRKYAHTIDPRTGYPVSHNLLSATIVAPDALTADAVATWCMVLGLDGARELVSSKGLEAYLIYDEGGEFRDWNSEGFEITSR